MQRNNTLKNKEGTKDMTGKGTRNSFLPKLFEILEEEKHPEVVSWSDDGKNILLKDIYAFAADVLPKYFGDTKYSSFIRQLSFYDFKRVSKSFDKGHVYFHPSFCRGKAELMKKIQRKSKNAKKNKESVTPETNHACEPYHVSCKEINDKLLLELNLAYEQIRALNYENLQLRQVFSENQSIIQNLALFPQNNENIAWGSELYSGTGFQRNLDIIQESTTQGSLLRASESDENNLPNNHQNLFGDQREYWEPEYAYSAPRKLHHGIARDFGSSPVYLPQAGQYSDAIPHDPKAYLQ